MNGTERLLVALNHQEPDCVPFDLGSTQVTGIQADVPPENIAAMWQALREYGRYS